MLQEIFIAKNELKAKTEKTKAETQQVGKPKVTINRKEGTTTSNVNIVHSGGSGKGAGTPNRPTKKVDYKKKYGLE